MAWAWGPGTPASFLLHSLLLSYVCAVRCHLCFRFAVYSIYVVHVCVSMCVYMYSTEEISRNELNRKPPVFLSTQASPISYLYLYYVYHSCYFHVS
uniref:Secreted protein n=1 Tax=Anopheles darlingi TaxID=43151 RepID=A0A2M4DCF0_ANODA